MKKPSAAGFTIVELLVVVVIIGILAAITVVSYTGISNKAIIASLKSDLSGASKQLKMFNVDNGYYPTTISTNCATAPTNTTNLCLKQTQGNSFTSTPYSNPTPQSFILTAVSGNNTYHITENSTPTAGAFFDPSNWLTIGTQTWAKVNLNVGTMITGATTQANNSILEKYCYNDTESNCTTYGGLYQWNEAMLYVTTDGAQGICPVGSHVPSDNDWKILEVQLGMTQVQADATGWRGTNQGTQLLSVGLGLNIPLAGSRYYTGEYFGNISAAAFYWSSSESGVNAFDRLINPTYTTLNRNSMDKNYGFSVRCLKS